MPPRLYEGPKKEPIPENSCWMCLGQVKVSTDLNTNTALLFNSLEAGKKYLNYGVLAHESVVPVPQYARIYLATTNEIRVSAFSATADRCLIEITTGNYAGKFAIISADNFDSQLTPVK